jgi:hypothetical protein
VPVTYSELLEILRKRESRYWHLASTKAGRRAERFKVRWWFQVAVVDKSSPASTEFDDGYAMNISATGLGLLTRRPMLVGSWCLCFIYPPVPDAPFTVLGKILWQKPINEVFATGIEFILWQDEREHDLALTLAQQEN